MRVSNFWVTEKGGYQENKISFSYKANKGSKSPIPQETLFLVQNNYFINLFFSGSGVDSMNLSTAENKWE